MPQYDAGPGEWSDRPWDDPNRKPKPQARRRRLILPPWALLVIVVALVIVLCVSLALAIEAIRGERKAAPPTPKPSATVAAPTATVELVTPTPAITPTATVVLPIEPLTTTVTFTEIAPGAMVIVQGTGGGGLNLRQQPTTYAKVLANVKEGTTLVVLEGPRDADGYVWWKVRAPDGKEGWAAAKWLVLK